MTDEYTHQPDGRFPSLPAPLRIEATYPASDGRVPESLVVEVGGPLPVDPAYIDRVIDALARVAACRDQPLGAAFSGAELAAAREHVAVAMRDGARRVAGAERDLATATAGSADTGGNSQRTGAGAW